MWPVILSCAASFLIGNALGNRFERNKAIGFGLLLGFFLGGGISALITGLSLSGDPNLGDLALRSFRIGAIAGALVGAYAAFLAYYRRKNGAGDGG